MNKKIFIIMAIFLLVVTAVYAYTIQGDLIVTGSVTTETILLENDVANHKIYDNSTCTIITGDTVELSIC